MDGCICIPCLTSTTKRCRRRPTSRCSGNVDMRLGDYQAALTDFKTAADLAPGLAGYRLRQATLMFQVGAGAVGGWLWLSVTLCPMHSSRVPSALLPTRLLLARSGKAFHHAIQTADRGCGWRPPHDARRRPQKRPLQRGARVPGRRPLVPGTHRTRLCCGWAAAAASLAARASCECRPRRLAPPRPPSALLQPSAMRRATASAQRSSWCERWSRTLGGGMRAGWRTTRGGRRRSRTRTDASWRSSQTAAPERRQQALHSVMHLQLPSSAALPSATCEEAFR